MIRAYEVKSTGELTRAQLRAKLLNRRSKLAQNGRRSESGRSARQDILAIEAEMKQRKLKVPDVTVHGTVAIGPGGTFKRKLSTISMEGGN